MPSKDTVERIVAYAAGLEGVNAEVLREGLQIASLHHQVEHCVETQWADWGLTARQVEILEALYHRADDTLTPADLSDEVGLTRSAMTSALDSLEKQGYTTRNPHPNDRRMVVISLTPLGQKFIGQHLPDRYKKFHQVMCIFSKDERASLLEMYKRIIDVLNRDVLEKQS